MVRSAAHRSICVTPLRWRAQRRGRSAGAGAASTSGMGASTVAWPIRAYVPGPYRRNTVAHPSPAATLAATSPRSRYGSNMCSTQSLTPALHALADEQVDTLSNDDLRTEMAQLLVAVNRLNAELTRRVQEFDRRGHAQLPRCGRYAPS